MSLKCQFDHEYDIFGANTLHVHVVLSKYVTLITATKKRQLNGTIAAKQTSAHLFETCGKCNFT